jgi:transcriptional regulator GlxA family with amidase domain
LRELQLDIDHISQNALWTNLYAQRLGKSAKFVVFVEAITLSELLAFTIYHFFRRHLAAGADRYGLRRAISFTSAQRFAVPVVSLDGCSRPDWVIVPAIGTKMPGPLQQALTRPDVAEAGDALRAWAADGVRIAAACVGTFLLAESGLLDGHDATTSWWLTPLFRQPYPEVRLDARRMLVPSGRLVTAGAALGHIDLALWLIRQASPELAALVAKYLIVDPRPMQSAYAISDHLAHADALVERFDRWARGRLAQS